MLAVTATRSTCLSCADNTSVEGNRTKHREQWTMQASTSIYDIFLTFQEKVQLHIFIIREPITK